MKLLTFAHKPEAQVFIESLNATLKVDGLYGTKDSMILITGEGISRVSQRLAGIYTTYGDRIKMVMNFGIAGALRDDIRLNDIYSVREVMQEPGNSIDYERFTCYKSKSNDLVCASVLTPVTDKHRRALLAQEAQLVDMEAWGLALTAKSHNLPFKAFKLVSDMCDPTLDANEIKKKAHGYSEALFQYYKKII